MSEISLEILFIRLEVNIMHLHNKLSFLNLKYVSICPCSKQLAVSTYTFLLLQYKYKFSYVKVFTQGGKNKLSDSRFTSYIVSVV